MVLVFILAVPVWVLNLLPKAPQSSPPPSPAVFLGVSSLLKDMVEVVAPQTTAPKSPSDQLADDLDEFKKGVLDLPPEEAARRWMNFYNRVVTLKATFVPYGKDQKLISDRDAVMTIIPGAAAWPEMEKLMEERAMPKAEDDLRCETVFRLFVHTLNNHEDKQWEDIDALYQQENPKNSTNYPFRLNDTQPQSPWFVLGEQLCQTATDGKHVVDFWNKVISLFEPAPIPSTPALPSLPIQPVRPFTSNADVTLNLPDLVPLVGADQATDILRRALILPQARVNVRGIATQRLARNLALSLIDKIQQPPWSLTNSIEGPPLYDALMKKFGPASDPKARTELGNGDIYQRYALIGQGRFEEVESSGAGLGDDSVAAANLYATGGGDKLYEYYRRQVVRGNDLWVFFLDVAGKTGHSSDALKTLQEVRDNPLLPEMARNRTRLYLFHALLASDHVEQGLAELVQCRDLPSTSKDPNDHYPYYWNIETRCNMTMIAARVCYLTGKQTQFDESMTLLFDLFKQAAATKDDLTTDELDDLSGTIELMIETNHAKDAELLLHILIAVEVACHRDDIVRSAWMGPALRREILLLITFYYEGQDWDDVLGMLDQFP
jgi:hypothetical protein